MDPAVRQLVAEAEQAHAAGSPARAAELAAQAAKLAPDAGEPHYAAGNALLALRRLDDAVASFRAAIVRKPGYFEAHSNLGVALTQLGRHAEAAQSYRAAVDLRPDIAELHNNLGVALREIGRLPEAIAALRQAVARKSDFIPARINLANALVTERFFDEAYAILSELAARFPRSAQVKSGLAGALRGLGRLSDAAAGYRAVLALNPDHVDSLIGLAAVLLDLGEPSAALDAATRAGSIDPNRAHAHLNRGLALHRLGRADEAITAYHEADRRRPLPETASNLGLTLAMVDEFPAAHDAFRRALTLRPDYVAARRNWLALQLYDPTTTEASLWQAGLEFGAAMAQRVVTKLPAPTNDRAPERRLRIGYVSSDLYDHPVGRNLEPVLAGRNKEKFELFAYAEIGEPDRTTERLRGLVDHWRPTLGLADEAVAQQIRADKIDILVLLAGRYDKNRPQIACWRPAPIQVSLHDPGSSGIAEMDYLVADPVLAPPNTSERFSERVVRLPSFYVHAPLEGAPAPGSAPAITGAKVTFGSFNSPAKLNTATLKLWSRVLDAVPGSRLKLKFKDWFATPSARDRVLRAVGVASERIEFAAGDVAFGDHLALYQGIDIALDPFPFTGSTTTFEALWMGVPVLTLARGRMAARWTAAMLHSIELDELVATTEDEYVAKAVALADDVTRVASLRAELRDRVLRSPLCDGAGKARQFERLYRAMWRRWCASAVN